MLSYNPALAVPYVTFEEYSRHTGIPMRTIQDYVRQGKIIIKKKAASKEKPLINLVAMNELAARETIGLTDVFYGIDTDKRILSAVVTWIRLDRHSWAHRVKRVRMMNDKIDIGKTIVCK
jgi:hypothetical protein